MLIGKNAKVSLDEVRAVPVPEPTATWFPQPYSRVIDLVKSEVTGAYGPLVREAYSLGRGGTQLFGHMAVDSGDDALQMEFGIRGSYGKTLSWAFVSGASVLVCDNMMFRGDSIVVVRKNTRYAWNDIERLVAEIVAGARRQFRGLAVQRETFRELIVETRRGYELIGRALGEGVLSSRQVGVAMDQWVKPAHAEFEPRTMWSLYNAFTEAAKIAAPGNQMTQHARISDYFYRLCRWAPIS